MFFKKQYVIIILGFSGINLDFYMIIKALCSVMKGGICMDPIKSVEMNYIKKDLPKFNPGDTVKVNVKVVEGGKERIQAYQGVVIRKRGSGLNQTFTVRRISYGIGVERIFMTHSPKIHSVEVLRRGKVRRAKLYYLRDRVGRAARIKERR